MGIVRLRTEAEMLRAHRKELDEKWKKRYPKGRFCVQLWKLPLGGLYYGLHFTERRPTSHVRYAGLTVEMNSSHSVPRICKFQNDSFGNCTFYSDLRSTVAGARRRGVPEILISTFTMKWYRND